MDTKLSSLLKNTLIFAVGNFGSKIILFLLVPLYTNYLTTSQYGIAEFVFTMSQLLYPIASLCVYEGLIRMGLKNNIREENALSCAIFIWLISCVVLLITTPLWSYYEPVAYWKWYLTVYTALHILCEIELDYLKVKEKNKLFALSSIIQTLFLALLNIYLLVFIHAGIEGYLIANTGSLLIEAIFIFVIGKLYNDLSISKFDFGLLKLMLSYSVPLIVNNISWWVIHSSDKIMIEAMLTSAALGLYTVATKIPSLINVFINIFAQSWGISSIKEMETSNDTVFYSKVFIAYSTFVMGFAILVNSITKPFMSFYVGSGFISSWRYVPLLILAAVLSSLAAYFSSLMGALQVSRKTMETTLIGAFVNILLNYLLIKIYGVWGAIFGTLAAYFIIALLRARVVLKCLCIEIPVFQIVKNLIIILVQAICVSYDLYIFIVSFIALIAFITTNRKSLSQVSQSVVTIYKKHLHN